MADDRHFDDVAAVAIKETFETRDKDLEPLRVLMINGGIEKYKSKR